MKLASYKSTRPGLQGLANRLIRWRFGGQESHTEIVFEPGDGVAALMPDGSCLSDEAGALWCASSVAFERMPAWSKYRAGKMGGVRFKRIALDPAKWDLVPANVDTFRAAYVFTENEGNPYSWRNVARFVAWLIELKDNNQTTCSQICARALGIPRESEHLFDPATLTATVKFKEGWA